MDYLARESAPISSELWEKIDAVVIDAARKHMVCRRFLSLHGPLGAGTSVVAVDGADKEESLRNGIGRTVVWWNCRNCTRISPCCGVISRRRKRPGLRRIFPLLPPPRRKAPDRRTT